MHNAIFRIKNLECSYDGKNPVLKVNKLEIPSGKLVVILGKSGAGKSTILETLGLMNKTIMKGKVYFYPEPGYEVDLTDLWKDEDKISTIRNNYMSFIFQNTNLMPNFTAAENACIPLLLQNKPYSDSINIIKKQMSELGLDKTKHDASVLKLSGGQKQRLAFIRAIAPRFSILFGDEPTGNLDIVKSEELMSQILSYIHNHHSSSLIVTHDIYLSLKYADVIMIMTKKEDDEFGEILEENKYEVRADGKERVWIGHDKVEIPDLLSIIKEKFKENGQ